MVLEKTYTKYKHEPHFLMIKELLLKQKIPEEFILKLVQDYSKNNKNMLQIITTTNILDTEYHQVLNYIMDLFYISENTPSISFEQLKLIYNKTQIDPDKFRYLFFKCSNISGYSKCPKTCVERPNKFLIKNIIHEIEIKFKCKLNDLEESLMI